MGGWLTANMVPVTALVANGTTQTAGGMNINGTITGGETISLTQLPQNALIACDVASAGGAPPQTVAATAFQVVSHAGQLISNTGTSSAGAATLNTVAGLITTESLTTAAGATYTFTLTNSLISTANTPPSPVPVMTLFSGTNTANGTMQINSITNGTGSTVAIFQNIGTAALNGKMLLAFHV